MAHEFCGRVWLLPDSIDTAQILSPSWAWRSELADEARMHHLFEELVPGLADALQPGDILWAGEGFGQGSSREDAPRLIKLLGVRVVLASSFARIFYRNSINIGLPVAVGDAGGTRDGDELEINLVTGEVHNRTRNLRLRVEPVSKTVRPILSEGGLIPYVRKRGRLGGESGGRRGLSESPGPDGAVSPSRPKDGD